MVSEEQQEQYLKIITDKIDELEKRIKELEDKQ